MSAVTPVLLVGRGVALLSKNQEKNRRGQPFSYPQMMTIGLIVSALRAVFMARDNAEARRARQAGRHHSP
ncbi:hypothetical protein [Hansschlegelia plantiphila]|uniref:hypothetical protein n=1 Tax=Hansschlegelia plantiphila TaxID=374655 RepID=UPI0022F26EEF|nr:hypothetical protein [Hansschlegelia plantiphila]